MDGTRELRRDGFATWPEWARSTACLIPSVTLDEPRYVMVSERGAYVVVSIDVRWLQDGAPEERTGIMTMALREEAEGWRISALAWTWN